MVILISVLMNCEFRVYITFCTAFEALNIVNDIYRCFFNVFTFSGMSSSLHFTLVSLTKTLYFRHFKKRHLSTLLALSVAKLLNIHVVKRHSLHFEICVQNVL